MTTQVQPHRLLHRGVIQAAGFFFDTRLLEEAQARERILALWRPGDVVTRLPEGLLLRLAAPQPVRCETAPGLPLILVGGLLLAAPLTPDELRRLNVPPNAILLTRGGAVVVYDPANSVQEDPAGWLDTTEWQTLRMETLGKPPAPPRLVAEPEQFDPRTRMTGVPPEAPERAQVLEALRKAAQTPAANVSGRGAGSGGKGEGWFQRIVSGVVRATEQIGKAEAKPGLGDAVHRFAMRLLATSGLAGIIGRRQAEYIGRMMEMFERGDLREALRHAIPMGEMEGKASAPALSVPTPRKDLTISSQRTLASSSLHLDADLHAHMMALYRQAFQKLEAEGRIEEAAFVLAELLGANEEAVAFLEKHKRFRIAAEMAEARNLPPGLVVRQWFLAGEMQRAILTARRTGAFADAVLRLERTDMDKARELRIHWAIALAAAGDYAGAVEALHPVMDKVWPIPEMQQRIGDWMEEAILIGGVVGAQMLAKKVTLFPDQAEEIRKRALVLLEDETPENAPERHAFTIALWRGRSNPLAKYLARAAARSVLRDSGTSPVNMDLTVWQSLVRFSEDAALRADVPLPASAVKAAEPKTPLTVQIAGADAGSLSVYDVAFLPGGRCLVALGEAGLRLLTRDGRTIVHADHPAHRLVVSDHGNQAIALAPRGDLWRMARIDLATRKVAVWQEAALRAFAPNYDGSLWFVAIGKDFLAIDATAPEWNALWRLPNLEGNILSIQRSETQCSFLLHSVGVTDTWGRPAELWTRLESWTHSLPNLFLRDRKDISCPPETSKEGVHYSRTLVPEGDVFYLNIESADANLPGRWNLVLTGGIKGSCHITMKHPIGMAIEQPKPLPPFVSSQWIAQPIRLTDRVECPVFDRKSLTLRAQITLEGAESVVLRFIGSCLAVADERGRLLTLDLEQGRLLRDLRMR